MSLVAVTARGEAEGVPAYVCVGVPLGPESDPGVGVVADPGGAAGRGGAGRAAAARIHTLHHRHLLQPGVRGV